MEGLSPRLTLLLGLDRAHESLFFLSMALTRSFPAFLAGSILFLCFPLPAAGENEIDFNRDIRPILSDKCFFCHGPDEHERKADLRLDTRDGALEDLGGYASMVPGKPEESEFVFRITDPDDPMPPEDSHKKLSQSEIALLTRWIAEGAPYSEPWAYVDPQKRPAPVVKATDWPRNDLDFFLLAALEGEGLTPSPDADRVTLLRRLTFDLTGLPPTPGMVETFVSETGDLETAWAALVDQLLASPRFGERMAMYWLDLVRFADTVGYHGDQDHNIAPYRDWVVDALNANLPFDQFTREQLAGDLLPNATTAQQVASGYNRLLQTSHEGGIQKKEYDAIYAADRVRNVSAVWMGATVGCAQCHDHKYDPFTMRDFYALSAFFSDIHDDGFTGNTLPSKRPPEILVYSAPQEAEMKELDEKLEALLPSSNREALGRLEAERRKLSDGLQRAKKPEQKRDFQAKLDRNQAALEEKAPGPKLATWRQLRRDRDAIAKEGRQTMVTAAKAPRETRILPRGNWLDDSGEIVAAAVPEFMGAVTPEAGDRATRLDLARWLTDAESGSGGLTARVMANRLWYLFFGNGISPSLEDFGGQGQPPTHPALLDHLAVTFVESGWDLKAVVRLIVTSRAYRQSSMMRPDLMDRDPRNQLFARQSRHRLPAEMIRDNALSLSGLLILERPLASVKPYQPAGYYRHLNFPTRKYEAHLDSRQWHRGLYVHWQRQFLHPMMKAMDAPSREECTAQRPRSNTPTAALVLLNDPSLVEAARCFAQRILAEGGETDGQRIETAYRFALSRPPDDEERRLLGQLFLKTRAEYESNPDQAKAICQTGIAPRPENYDPVELASWTAVARALLNLNETNARN